MRPRVSCCAVNLRVDIGHSVGANVVQVPCMPHSRALLRIVVCLLCVSDQNMRGDSIGNPGHALREGNAGIGDLGAGTALQLRA